MLSEYGQRTSSAIREFCKALDKDSLDIDLKWEETKQRSVRGEMRHGRAKYVSSVIKDATIEVDEVTFVGMLITSTMSKRDKIRIRTEDGAEK